MITIYLLYGESVPIVVACNIKLPAFTAFDFMKLAQKFAFAPRLRCNIKEGHFIGTSIFVFVVILFLFKKIIGRRRKGDSWIATWWTCAKSLVEIRTLLRFPKSRLVLTTRWSSFGPSRDWPYSIEVCLCGCIYAGRLLYLAFFLRCMQFFCGNLPVLYWQSDSLSFLCIYLSHLFIKTQTFKPCRIKQLLTFLAFMFSDRSFARIRA